MESLGQAARAKDVGGHALPSAWPSLEARGVQIRTGELSVIAGAPASGKSSFALATAYRMRVPTLYICADTAAWTVTLRAIAMVSGLHQHQVESRLLADPHACDGALQDLKNIRWCFEPSPSLDDIDQEVAAYEEVYGRNPDLIVVDNAIDVADGPDEWQSLRRTMRELKYLAADTGAAVVVLHHVTEAIPVPDGQAPARYSILGKDTRLPSLVLTLTNQEGWLGCAVVKSRYSESDPHGKNPTWFSFDGSRMRLAEVEQ